MLKILFPMHNFTCSAAADHSLNMASEEKREEKTNKDSISNKFADDPEMLEARVFIGNLKSSKVGSP